MQSLTIKRARARGRRGACCASRRSRSAGCCSPPAATARRSLPEIVQIESTNICNAKCVFCPRDEMHREQGIMDMALFQKIADECAALGITHVRMHNYGEAFVDRQLVEKVRYAKAIGIREVGLISNGSLITETRGARHDRGRARRDQHQRGRRRQGSLRVDAARPQLRQGHRQHRAPGPDPRRSAASAARS